ncbi:VWA domain-containing protein [Geodermatophilus sp. URMC 64]
MTRPTSPNWVRRALVLWALSVGLLGVALTHPSPAGAVPSPTGSQSLQSLGACLTGTKHADVLLLVDESHSLTASDPADARVTAAQLLLDRLADTAARTDSTIDLAVNGFSSGVRPALDWQPLNTQTKAGAIAAVADFAIRDDGFETDYWTALSTAHQQLLDRREPDAAQPCQALVLFTDGEYDLTPRTTPSEVAEHGQTIPIPGVEGVPITSEEAADRVEAAGREDICRAGGVTDGLRRDKVLTIAIGLSGGGSIDLGLLSSIAESAPDPCGTIAPYGFFLAASDVEDLVLAFDAIGDPANPPQPVDEQGVCEFSTCPQEAHSFVLDASIQSLHLVGTSDAAGVEVYVQPPDVATPVRLAYDAAAPAGTAAAGDLALEYTWFSDGAFSVDAQIPAGGGNWTGEWQVVFVDPTGQHPDAVSRTQLTIQADLGAVVAPGTDVEWRVGDDLGAVPMALVRTDGTPAVLGVPAPTLALKVVLLGASSREEVLAENVPGAQLIAGVPLSVPEDFPSGQAELRTELSVTTVSGLVLQPQVRTQQIAVLPPLGFPTVKSDRIDFGRLEGTAAGTGGLEVSGPGCVSVVGAALTVRPSEVENVTAALKDGDELCLADGENRTIDLELASRDIGAGDLQGDVTLALAPADHPERVTEVQVPFLADLVRPANGSVRLLVLLAALVVGIGVPVLVFLLGRKLAARLPDTALRSVLLPVRIGPNGLQGADGGTPVLPEQWDLVPPIEGGRRRARLSGVGVRARAGAKLTAAGFAEVEGDGRVGVSGAPGGRAPRTLRARLPLALAGSWTVLVERSAAASDEPDVAAQLLLVSDSAAAPTQREEILVRARAEAPAAVESLRTAVGRGEGTGGTSSAGPVQPTPLPDDPFSTGWDGGVPAPAPSPLGVGTPAASSGDPFASGGWGTPAAQGGSTTRTQPGDPFTSGWGGAGADL